MSDKREPGRIEVLMVTGINIGDRITFRAACVWSDRTQIRVVNGFVNGFPTVRFGGWPNFLVRPDEILSVASV